MLLITLLLVLLGIAAGAVFAGYLMPRAAAQSSFALPVAADQTELDRVAEAVLAQRPGQTGVALLNDGLDAFAARVLTARAAERSLDLQYYMWCNDLCGQLLALEVWRAAERGVRVRLLLDDMNAQGLDAQMMALDIHANIEVRLYNAFRNRNGIWRWLEMIVRALRINYRMHNKAWIADGRIAMVGGRNIGVEYFSAATATNFRDLDLLLMGPAVADADSIFDAYWNSKAVVPLRAVSKRKIGRLRQLINDTEQQTDSNQAQAYLSRVRTSASVEAFLAGKLNLLWCGQVSVVADPPRKWRGDDRQKWLVGQLINMISESKNRALLISPYFVPGREGTERLVELMQRGVELGIVTNSLAANDVPAVHSGYARYRKPLLGGGAALYELRAQIHKESYKKSRKGKQAGSAGLFGSGGASLHTKAFIVDGQRGFVGSFNLDARSASLNTEMGVLFDDPHLGAALEQEYEWLTDPAISYGVYLDEGRNLYWKDVAGQSLLTLHNEPDASLVRRITAMVLGWLPIESQL